MQKSKGLLASVVTTLLFLTNPGNSEEIEGSNFRSGNWQGAAYTSDSTGEFSHCAISTPYVSGDTLLFSVNRDATVSVGLQGALGLREGQQFPVALYVDRRAPFYGTAYALSRDFAILNITDFDAAMVAFRKGYLLRIEALGGVSEYSLQGTFRALEAARQCALRHFDFASAPSTIDKTEAFQLATTIISELRIEDFRYLSEAELQRRQWGNAVAWEAETDGIMGLSLVGPWQGEQELKANDASDTQFIAEGCDGDYVTSARTISVGDEREGARELRLVCESEGQTTETYLTKFLAGDRIVYTILVFDLGKNAGSDQIDNRVASEEALLRAARFMRN